MQLHKELSRIKPNKVQRNKIDVLIEDILKCLEENIDYEYNTN